MVQIKLSIAFILAAAVIAPIVAQPLPERGERGEYGRVGHRRHHRHHRHHRHYRRPVEQPEPTPEWVHFR